MKSFIQTFGISLQFFSWRKTTQENCTLRECFVLPSFVTEATLGWVTSLTSSSFCCHSLGIYLVSDTTRKKYQSSQKGKEKEIILTTCLPTSENRSSVLWSTARLPWSHEVPTPLRKTISSNINLSRLAFYTSIFGWLEIMKGPIIVWALNATVLFWVSVFHHTYQESSDDYHLHLEIHRDMD